MINVLPVNRVRYNLLTRVWPICFAVYLAAQAVYGSGADRHPFADRWFDIFSWVVVALLLTVAVQPKIMLARALSGVGVVGICLARAGWFFDPNFVASQRLFAASVFALLSVSAIGWVMAADFAVMSARMRREDGD